MKLASRIPPEFLICVLAVALAWICFERFASARADYEGALAALDESGSLVSQISLLRQKPDRAAVQSRSDRSLAEAIEKAAETAGLAREQIARIEPQAARRSGEYLEHPTVVQFDDVLLTQLSGTLAALRTGKGGMEDIRVSSLRLAAPYQEFAGKAEKWNIELTLTYLVYSPTTPPARK